MVSGIPTASGYEERIRFSEMEVVDRGANEQGLVVNLPEGNMINGWDVNVAGVRTVSVKRHVRRHQHAEFLLRVKHGDQSPYYVSRRFGDFAKMHKRLRTELPGKVLPPLPRKNKSGSLYTYNDDDDDGSSVSSISTQGTNLPPADPAADAGTGLRGWLPSWGGGTAAGHRKSASRTSLTPGTASPRVSMDSSMPLTPAREASPAPGHMLVREDQRVSLRAFLRNFLQNDVIAPPSSATQQ
jgi:hypothetical protein